MPGSPALSEDELLAQARSGDLQAFRVLVERLTPAVSAVVVGMLGAGPDAEDVLQETFVRFFRALHRFRGEARLQTYVTRIAVNESLKVLHRRRRWRRVSWESFRTEQSSLIPNEEIDERLDRRQLVRWALDQLPPRFRAVVVLRLMEGYSTEETARMLGIPPGTVMSRLARALQRLRQLLIDHDSERKP